MAKTLDAALDGLRANEPNVRREAAMYLAGQPSLAACEALLLALGDDDPRANEAIIAALVDQTTPDRIARLVSVLREDSSARRNAALSTLIEIGARAPEALATALHHPSTEVRLHAAEVLGDLRHPASGEALIERLNDANEFPNVRHAAAQALGKIGDRAATPALIAAAEQGDFWVRYAAIEALGRLADEAAVGPLLRLLKQDVWMRPATVQALGNLGRVEAVADLAAALDDPNDTVRSAAIEAILKIVVEPSTEGAAPAPVADELRQLIPVAALRRELNTHLVPGSGYAAHLLGWLAPPEALPDLITALGEDDETLRHAAVEAILRYGPTALDPLRAALGHPNAGVRENAVELLGILADPAVVPSLVEHLDDTSNAVRQAVLRALGSLGGEGAYQGLLTALNDPSTREMALSVLGQLRDPGLVDSLRHALYDGQTTTRAAAAQALSVLGDEAAVSSLLNAVRQPDGQSRLAAAEALGRVRNNRAVGLLIEALTDREPLVRQKAVEALGNIPDGRAVAALLALAAQRESEWRVRKALVYALVRVGDSRVVGALEELARDPNRLVRRAVMELCAGLDDPRIGELLARALPDAEPSVRRSALISLGRRREPSHARAAAACLGDEHPTVRAVAVRALAQLDPELAAGELVLLVSDPTENVRQEVADALGEAGLDAGVGALEALLRDEAPGVRARAAEALGLISTPRAVTALATALLDSRAREHAQHELGRLGVPALRVLLTSARAADPALRAAAAATLGRLRNPQALPTLRLLTRDEDAAVRQAAAEALEAFSASN